MAKIINTANLDLNKISPDEGHWIYNGLDCGVTWEIFRELDNVIDDTARKTYEMSKALQAPILEMNLRGVLVNQNRRRKVVKEMEEKLVQLKSQFDILVEDGVGIPPINWNSPHQVKRLLYDVMKLPVQRKRNASGAYAPSTDRDALEKLSINFIAQPIVNHLLGMRDLGKSLGFLRTQLDSDGRMRTNFSIAGTVTGRFASSISDLGTGTNLQNIAESLRSIFVADPGYKFANLDLEQADSRNVGALCWNLLCDNPDWTEESAGAYLDICENGDLHTIVTRMANPGLPWDQGQTDREVADMIAYRHLTYRDLSKKLGHGSNYLGTPPTMAKHAKIPTSMAAEFQNKYFQGFPCIPAWHQSVFWALENLGFLESPFGRRRFFFGRPKDGATRREAVAHVPQSMTADEINLGILALWRSNRVQLLIQVHDSILFQYREEEEDEILPWALETLKTHLVLKKGRPFYVPTEAKVGWNWGRESKDNPDGLIKWKGSDSRKRQETKFKLALEI